MLEICYYANKAFESQIFCSIMVSFLVTLFCLYGALYTVSNPLAGKEDSEIIILLFFVREIAVHAIPALILVHICGKILKKADEVERIVYKMIRYNTNENLQSIVRIGWTWWGRTQSNRMIPLSTAPQFPPSNAELETQVLPLRAVRSEQSIDNGGRGHYHHLFRDPDPVQLGRLQEELKEGGGF